MYVGDCKSLQSDSIVVVALCTNIHIIVYNAWCIVQVLVNEDGGAETMVL